MSWTERLSTYIAKKITPSDANYTVEQVSHGLELFLLNIGYTLILLLVTYFLNCFSEALIITIILVLTRAITGGLHLKSANACILVTTFLILAGATFVNQLPTPDSSIGYIIVLLSSAIAMYINYKHAPAEHIYSTHGYHFKKKLKKLILFCISFSCLLGQLLVYFGYIKPALAYSFAIVLQSVLLHPGLINLIRNIETHLMREE